MAQQFDMASSSGIPAAINLRSSVIVNLQKEEEKRRFKPFGAPLPAGGPFSSLLL